MLAPLDPGPYSCHAVCFWIAVHSNAMQWLSPQIVDFESSACKKKDNTYLLFLPPHCFCDSLRCGAYGTLCYGIS